MHSGWQRWLAHPQWKLIRALQPDFTLNRRLSCITGEDPEENNNLAEAEPEVVAMLTARMEAFIAKREAETGLPDPIMTQGDWHGHAGVGAFKTSQQAYDTMHIGDPAQAAKLQAESRK